MVEVLPLLGSEGAEGAGEEPLAGVDPEVALQVGGLDGPVLAVRAGVLPLARVPLHVEVQGGLLSRPVLAVGARVVPLARVDPHVLLQAAPPGGAEAAVGAGVRLLHPFPVDPTYYCGIATVSKENYN